MRTNAKLFCWLLRVLQVFFLLKLEDGQNEHIWRPPLRNAAEDSDDCECCFVNVNSETGEGLESKEAAFIVISSDSDENTGENECAASSAPAVDTPSSESAMANTIATPTRHLQDVDNISSRYKRPMTVSAVLQCCRLFINGDGDEAIAVIEHK
ncbi:hypothetical protein F443_20847 [Phytophthora nicotianae P1569]|uniref:Uncharacterized protein n=1 Tax=Phytophthora nicotianae P1569 TaxID=1317065 RepID=V9E029_PHYNI|nr:hypothetical protein F443_20847 [Phytophthora nicotianae P1569]